MSLETQSKNILLHSNIMKLMDIINVEALFSNKLNIHQRYDMIKRFIIGQKYDIVKAEKKLRETLEWRKNEKIDDLLDDTNPVITEEKDKLIKQIYPHSFHGTGAGGRVVYIERTGLVNRIEMYKKLKEHDLSIHFSRVLERGLQTHWNSSLRIYNRLQAKKKAAAHSVDEKIEEPIYPEEFAEIPEHPFIFIFDLKGLAFGDISGQAIDYFKSTVSIQQKHYPECLHKMFIINAPFYFTAGWDLVAVFIEKEVAAKIEVIGDKFKDILQKTVPDNNIPTFLGGDCRLCDPDIGCVPILAADVEEEKKN